MKHCRSPIITAIGIVASLLTILTYTQKIDFFNAIDLKLRDVRFKIRGNIRPDQRVVVVAIDGKSINELGRWPWDRKLVARLVDNLRAYGAKTVAFDVVFSEPSNPDSDGTLAQVISTSGNVIAGYFFREEMETQSVAATELLGLAKIKIVRMLGDVEAVPVVSYPHVETNIPLISRAAVNAGFFNIIPDRDGLIRAANLLMLYEGQVYPALSLAALRHYLGSEVILDLAPYGVDGLLLGNRRIPVDESGALSLNYYGQQGSFQTVSAVDVINNRLGSAALKDGLVFIGATEIGICDVRVTPLDPVLPGVDIHATVASNVLENRFLIRNGLVIGLEIAFIVLFPILLAVLLGLVRRTVIALTSFLGMTGIYLLVNYLLFAKYALNMGVIFPIISISITYIGSEAYRNLVEEKQGRFLRKAFASYVSPELVGEIIKNPGMLKLGGEKREISVLFADIRSFTTLSENLPPETLVSMLNQYLGPMTNIVLEQKGTLDKYIGDAIMAIFNAPLRVENHAQQACETALQMMSALKEINAKFKGMGLPEINIGIGINTAKAIVGNMGTDTRFDYTAVGDAVNLASRLEGLNKIYNTNIIVSEFTVNHIKQGEQFAGKKPFVFRELDLIKAKGKEMPVVIYELSLGLEDALIEEFTQALRLYREGRLEEARDRFSSLVTQYQDKPSAVFAGRCEEFMVQNHAGDQWDGTYVAKTK